MYDWCDCSHVWHIERCGPIWSQTYHWCRCYLCCSKLPNVIFFWTWRIVYLRWCIDTAGNSLYHTTTLSGIRAIAENLSALTSVNIAHCALVTDISLLHLTKHCASTLTALHMKNIKLVRVGVLLHMLKHCTHLNTLSFSFDINVLYQTIVPNMGHLTTILVHSTLQGNVISSIAKHCTKQQKFGISRLALFLHSVLMAVHRLAHTLLLSSMRRALRMCAYYSYHP